MGAFISKQPNGLYCRFSNVVDCPTNWNMTREDYIKICIDRAIKDANDVLNNYLNPFAFVIDRTTTMNMTKKEFKKFIEETKQEREEL